MDPAFTEQLVETLRRVTAPDTTAIQEASQALQNNFYKSEFIVPALVNILQTHPEMQIRQLAGVEARKLIDYRWNDLRDDIKTSVKSNILQTTMAEPESLVRHTSSRVISTIGKKDLDENLWPELLPALSSAVRSSNVAEREVSVYILYTLLEADLGVMSDHITDLLNLFAQSIKDPESLQVRVSTIMALGEISSVLSAFDNKDNSDDEIFRSTVPSMVEVLNQVIEANDEKAVSQIFEVFSFLLVVDSNLTSKYFGDLVKFILNNIAANNQLSDEFRVPALQYLINAVRPKKMKLQSLKLGSDMVRAAMNILADYYRENDEDLDEEDQEELAETNPATLSLQLIDNMSSSLPPTQVNTALLQTLNEFVASGDVSKARAGFMALAYAIEGAPDFFATHIEHILPLVVAGLQQPDLHIQCAVLFALCYLGVELRESISEQHEILLPLVFGIMERATNLKVGKNAFQALDAILECMDRHVITEKYLDTLVPKLLHLFSATTNVSLKALISATISSTAYSAGKNFLPYFQNTMQALEPYIALSQNIENLPENQADLCASALDTIGSIAASVGKENFKPFVEILVEAAYKCLKAKSSKARESSFICIGTLAKIYGQEFAPVAPKVVEELYACLDQDEFAELPNEVEDIGMEDENDIMEKFEASSAIAIEKEYAADALGDLIEACKGDFPDIKKAVTYLASQAQHYSEGLRKAAVSGLWRAYTTWVKLDNEGKWVPGIPTTEHPNEITATIAQITRTDSLEMLENEEDRDVATLVCQRIEEGLRIIGPRVILNDENLEQLVTQIGAILIKQHRCQSGLEDEAPEEDGEFEESSEYDALLIDSAFNVVVQIAASLGSQFIPLFPTFFGPISKFCASSTATERASAIGSIAEVINGMGSNVTQYTDDLMQTLLHSIVDKNIEVRSNAAYGIGLLCYYSEDTQKILSHYPVILDRLQGLLKKVDKAVTRSINANSDSDDNNARCLSNACGCVSRMILKHPHNVPVSDVVKVLLTRLPLVEGLEENAPVFDLLVELFKNQEPTVLEHRAEIVNIFAQVFEQERVAKLELENVTTGITEIELPFETDESRAKVIELLKFLESQQAGLVSSHQILVPILA